ncbi:MAG: hypothetical protein ACI9H6_000402 [Patiriisocius sp.]|jgi:hypothetical protein
MDVVTHLQELPKRVANGSLWMDITSPGWHKGIIPDSFHIGFSDECIFGQILGDFNETADQYLTDREQLDFALFLAVSNDITLEDQIEYHEAATAEWNNQIDQRIAADAVKKIFEDAY